MDMLLTEEIYVYGITVLFSDGEKVLYVKVGFCPEYYDEEKDLYKCDLITTDENDGRKVYTTPELLRQNIRNTR